MPKNVTLRQEEGEAQGADLVQARNRGHGHGHGHNQERGH
jgi:hypothetical protein